MVGIPYIYSDPNFQISFSGRRFNLDMTNTNLPAILNPFHTFLIIITGNLGNVPLRSFSLSRKPPSTPYYI